MHFFNCNSLHKYLKLAYKFKFHKKANVRTQILFTTLNLIIYQCTVVLKVGSTERKSSVLLVGQMEKSNSSPS